MDDLDNGDVIDNTDVDAAGEQQPEDRGDELHPDVTTDTLDAVIGDDDSDATANGDGGDGDSGGSIPRGRFNEVIEERNWLREQLRAQQGGAGGDDGGEGGDSDDAAQSEPFDFDAKEREYMNAVYEGDQDKALDIRREINNQIRAETEGVVQQNFQQRTMKDALGAVAAKAVEQYPFLNSEADGADPDAIEMTLSLRQHYEAQGSPPHEALAKAVEKVGPRFATADSNTPAGGDNRQADRTRRNAQANANQPPSLKGGGVGDRAADVIPAVGDLSEEQFEALTEKEKAAMRGDSVA